VFKLLGEVPIYDLYYSLTLWIPLLGLSITTTDIDENNTNFRMFFSSRGNLLIPFDMSMFCFAISFNYDYSMAYNN
jgi:hypothetical protein